MGSLSQTVSINIVTDKVYESNEIFNVNLSTPNPAVQTAIIQLNGYTGAVSIKLMTAEGKLLQHHKLELNNNRNQQVPISVGNYANGHYLVIVTDEKGNARTEKLKIIH